MFTERPQADANHDVGLPGDIVATGQSDKYDSDDDGR